MTDPNRCPTGWPRHSTPQQAQADARRRNALNRMKNSRWRAWSCCDCQGAHVTPFAKSAMRNRSRKAQPHQVQIRQLARA